jgi:hypothetical protein
MHGTELDRPRENDLIKAVTAQSVCGFGQLTGPVKGAEAQLEPPYPGRRSQHEFIPHTQRFKQRDNLGREIFAADFVAWELRFLDQDNIAPCLARSDRS